MTIVMPHDLPERLFRNLPYLEATNPDRVRIEPALLAELVKTVFFASIATDEGRLAPLRVVYSERDDARRLGVSRVEGETIPWAWRARRLARPRRFTVEELARCARPLQSSLSYVLVGEAAERSGALSILGFAHEGFDGPYLSVLAPQPGCLQFKFMPDAIAFEYRNGGVRLAPPEVFQTDGPIRRRLLAAARSIGPEAGLGQLYCMVVGSLVYAMDSHRRGGILALLPGSADHAEQFLPLEDITLSRELQELIRLREELAALGRAADGPAQVSLHHAFETEARWHEHCIRRLIAELGGFTAVDGATLVAEDLNLVAFGGKLSLESKVQVFEATCTDPVAGGALPSFDLSRRGARHLAAASFAWQLPGAVVFIASEDGGTRCFFRDEHAARVLVWRCRPIPRFGIAESRRRGR